VEAFPSETPIALIKLILITFKTAPELRNKVLCILKLTPVWGCLTLVMARLVRWVKVRARVNINHLLIVGKAVKFGYLIVITSKFEIKLQKKI
jgi:hypothetical protein